jgi:hypothetical protein
MLIIRHLERHRGTRPWQEQENLYLRPIALLDSLKTLKLNLYYRRWRTTRTDLPRKRKGLASSSLDDTNLNRDRSRYKRRNWHGGFGTRFLNMAPELGVDRGVEEGRRGARNGGDLVQRTWAAERWCGGKINPQFWLIERKVSLAHEP